MRFLIDECLHNSLVGVAHAAGYDAVHVNHLGLAGWPDWALAQRVTADEFTFVTNNRMDFIELFSQMDLHTGLIVLVPNVVPSLQRKLFQAALQFVDGREPINSVIEVRLQGSRVCCEQYDLPTR
jgi:predicted nuclease of predicted toxin-antitoxin system